MYKSKLDDIINSTLRLETENNELYTSEIAATTSYDYDDDDYKIFYESEFYEEVDRARREGRVLRRNRNR